MIMDRPSMILIASCRRALGERVRDALRADHLPSVIISNTEELDSLDDSINLSLVLLCQEGKEGYDLDERIRSLAISRNIPLALISASSGPDEIMAHIEQDFTYRISSPLESATLGPRICSIIETHKIAAKNDHHADDISLQDHPRLVCLAHDLSDSSRLNRRLISSHHSLAQRVVNAEKKGNLLSKEEEIMLIEMQEALDRNEFELFFQPIISLEQKRITGFESLIRWNHPLHGIISPDEFIPLAEKSEIIHELGDRVINEACRYIALAHEHFPRKEPLTLSFNVSNRQFVKPDLCDRITRAADKYGIDHQSLRMEITESTIMHDMEASNLMLLNLKSRGFKLYMDDFGTGYSSLSYLRHFPVDVLKIDKSFVEWIHIDEESEVIVKTIVDLAHNLGMSVIAEGVESIDHLEKLRSFRCDYGQGYYFSRPIPVEKVMKLLEADPEW